MKIDPTAQRVSSCPVHFIWDGRGIGRPLVRYGFLGLVAAAILATGAVAFRADALHAAGIWVLTAAGASYALGQVASFAASHR